MSVLNFGSYVEALRPYLMKNSAKNDAALFLLNSVKSQIPESGEGGKKNDITKDGTLNKMLRGVEQVPEYIRLATAKTDVVEGVIKYFRGEVTEDLNPNLKDEALETFTILVRSDVTLNLSRKDKLLALLEGGDFALFLAESFIYAINRPARLGIEDGKQKISIPLLIFVLIYGLGIYFSTMLTIIITRQFSMELMAFAFFFSIGISLFLLGFYFFLWRRDI